MRFSDYTDPDTPYMYHCHLPTHEDEGMMGQFVIVEPGTENTVNRTLPANHGLGHVSHLFDVDVWHLLVPKKKWAQGPLLVKTLKMYRAINMSPVRLQGKAGCGRG